MNSAIGKWVASLIPYEQDSIYCEPYAGMLGVLLGRTRSKVEIASDLNERITNWWQAVRDQPDELLYKLTFAPNSESFLLKCKETIDEGSVVDRAMKFFVVISGSINHTDRAGKATFVLHLRKSSRDTERIMENIRGLADRLRRVQLLHRPAVDILDSVKNESKAIVYCDPPYLGADYSPYPVKEIDFDNTLELLRTQKGRVAISGYGDTWDSLGWERSEFETSTTMSRHLGEESQKRVEVLWTNYKPEKQEKLI